ncbi:hypothetical protein ACTHSJ_18940 [Paenibacillus cellulositrophicus]|uniref:hypothetical protein n=1 Tax=Paenibacillus cellulositrophicus TaxID=562959 RepID=UPI003F8006B8
MIFKKIWRILKIVYSIVFIFVILGIVSLIAIIMYGALADKKALVNSALINSITLILGLLSLPGIIVQLISMLTINEKKKYIAETKCPNCKHLVDIKLREE